MSLCSQLLSLLLTLFPILISTKSKSLRGILFQKIISELRSANVKSHNHRLNRTFQTVLFQLVTADRASPQAIWAVRLTRELWRRRAWTDSRAVEIMKEASLAEDQKVTSGGVRFFLGADQEGEESSSDDSDDEIDVGRLKHQAGVSKKTKKKKRNFEKALAIVKRVWMASCNPCARMAVLTRNSERSERTLKKQITPTQLFGTTSPP